LRRGSRLSEPVCGELLISPESAIRHKQDREVAERFGASPAMQATEVIRHAAVTARSIPEI